MIDSKRIFLDTNPIIYYVERKEGYAEKLDDFFRRNMRVSRAWTHCSLRRRF